MTETVLLIETVGGSLAWITATILYRKHVGDLALPLLFLLFAAIVGQVIRSLVGPTDPILSLVAGISRAMYLTIGVAVCVVEGRRWL